MKTAFCSNARESRALLDADEVVSPESDSEGTAALVQSPWPVALGTAIE